MEKHALISKGTKEEEDPSKPPLPMPIFEDRAIQYSNGAFPGDSKPSSLLRDDLGADDNEHLPDVSLEIERQVLDMSPAGLSSGKLGDPIHQLQNEEKKHTRHSGGLEDNLEVHDDDQIETIWNNHPGADE